MSVDLGPSSEFRSTPVCSAVGDTQQQLLLKRWEQLTWEELWLQTHHKSSDSTRIHSVVRDHLSLMTVP